MRLNYLIYALVTLVILWLFVGSRMALMPSKITDCQLGYIYDGDTIELICDGRREKARITGFDTPETRDAKCEAERALGLRARVRLSELLSSSNWDYVDLGHDRYGRKLISLERAGESLGEIMISEGLAAPYKGGARRDWCAVLEAN